jgi:phage terminase large subunit-like protein
MTPRSNDLLTAMLRKAQRALARNDVATFIEYVSGQEPFHHHREMLDFAIDIVDRKAKGVILEPRGAGKTTILTTGFLPWLIATRPDIRIGLFSQKDKKAEAMSSAIMGIMSESPEFIEIFGNLRGDHKWTASEWMVKGSPHYKTNNATMITGGAAQSSGGVSKRFDLLILDDVLDENNTSTIDQRDKIETWFWKTLKPTQAAEGCAILVIGTRWVEDDLYQKLIEDNKWPALIVPALSVDGETGEETSYWPEVWPLERLYAEREDVGWDNFACSYLNDISGLREGTIFRRDWWKDQYFETLPNDRTYVFTMGIDLASSERERADWTTRVIVAQDSQNEHWVLHHERTKTDSGHREFVEGGWRWAQDHGYPISRIVIENNQHQSTLVQQLLKETSLPVVGRRADVDKRTRARATAARYESHRVHHHESLRGRELETEMLGFPKGHDDLVDALGLAMDLQGVSGSIAGVNVALRDSSATTEPRIDPGAEVIFRDGPRIVPAYVAQMLYGIATEDKTYTEAIQAMNANRLNDYIRGLTKGMLRGRQ